MYNEQLEQNNEISLIDLFKILLRNFVFIMVITLLFGLIAVIYAFAIVNPKYKSDASVLLQVEVIGASGVTYDLPAAQRLVPSTVELLTLTTVLEEVIEDLDLKISSTELREHLTIRSTTTSTVILISYLGDSPVESKRVVNQLITNAIVYADENIASLEAKIIRVSQANTGVYDSPNRVLYVFIGLILGGIVGVGLVFVNEMFSNTFRTKEQLEQTLGIDVLGIIPDYRRKEQKHD